MHHYETPDSIKQRVLRRQGKLASHDTIDASRAALVVVDMQNYFVAEGFPAEVPIARTIVPNINRMAKAMRAAGGTVVWIQTSSAGALKYWGRHHHHQLTPERSKARIAGLDESAEAFKLYPQMDVLPNDLRVKKATYSAFMPPGSSDIDAQLKSRGIESVLITGTATNVCCESNARDAMFLDYRVIMLSDGNATWTDEEHAVTLNNVMLFFGDVMTTDEAIAKLVPVAQRKSA
ncbi:MAG TPA: cysteine hydrolase [Xanthobacteraceae bacterium]|jgi:ureidoacrylate peracid hydrolase